MPPKKKMVDFPTKQSSRNRMQVYIERYKEIEIYLTLLTKPLLSNIFPTTPVGNTLFDKIEVEIKAFLEGKLQSLTGLDQDDALEFSKEEISALKLVASTILSKKEQVSMPEYVAPENVQTEFAMAEHEQQIMVEESTTIETDSVTVEEVQISPAAKKMRQRKSAEEQTPVHPTEVPKIDGPTDRVKRSRPKGNIQPLARLSPEQEAAIAQAQANQSSMMSDQMMVQSGGMINNDVPNFGNENLSYFR